MNRRRRRYLVAAILLGLVLLPAAWLLWLSVPAAPQLPGRLEVGQLQWQGHERRYTVYTPRNVAVAPALVLVFHGSGSNADQIRVMYGYAFDELAEEHGFIVLYPEGYERHFNGCRAAGPYAANRLNIDDVGFLRALVGRYVARGADPRAVYATGVSNGGQMALRLALEAPDLVAAAAPVATSLPTPGNMDCTPSGKPVAFLLMNGTHDPMNPYRGGTVALYGLLGNRGEVLSSQKTVAYFAELAGYTAAPREEALADLAPGDGSTVTVSRWQAPDRPPVALYTVHGGGHGAPHPQVRMPRLLGGSNRDISAAHEIWAFFQTARDTR